MTDGIATQHVITAVEHLRKLRAYLAPRSSWQLEAAARESMLQAHRSLAGLSAAVQRLMAVNHLEMDLSSPSEPLPPAAAAGVLDGAQLARVAAFVGRLERWFAARDTAQLSAEGGPALVELHRLLLEAVRAAEAVMAHNHLHVEGFQVALSDAPASPIAAPTSADELPDHLARLCPKCGAPRVAGVHDCPSCGVIYERAVQQAVQEGEAESLLAAREESAHPADADDGSEYGEAAPLGRPLPPARPLTRADRLRAAIDEDAWVFVVGVLLLYLGVVALMTGRLIGGSDSVRVARDVFHEATGRALRFPLPNAMALNWVDHRLVVFTSSDQQLQLMLYTEGALARKTDLELLHASVEELLQMYQLPIAGSTIRREWIGPNEIEVRELRVGESTPAAGRAYLSIFTNQKGWPVVLFLSGPQLEVRELAAEVFAGG